MDRDELQDRIRARRSGSDPYRRGAAPDEGTGGYRRFEPEPEDSQARRSRSPGERRRDAFDESALAAGAAANPPSDRPDITRESEDWAERPSLVPPMQPSEPSDAAAPPPPLPPPADEQAYVDNYDDDAAYPYEYDEWDDGRERRSSGAGAFAILGFLALGVLALLGGAVLAGVFNGGPSTAVVDPTLTPSPSIAESIAPSQAPSTAPSSAGSPAPSGSPPASGEPVVFPDGFTAVAEPCQPGTMRRDGSGCDSNAATNSGSVEIYVGFSKGSSQDVIGAEIIGPDGSTVGEGSIDLATIDCGNSCNGWTWFAFGNLDPGTYEVEITRNGDLAGTTSFEVT